MRPATPAVVVAVAAMFLLAPPASPRDKKSKPKQSIFLVGASVKTSILFLRKAPENCCCPADTAGEWGGKPRIMLLLSNKSARPLWLVASLTPPSLGVPCELRSSVGAKEKTDFFFTQDSVQRGDYALTVMSFADSAFADTVESVSWTFQPR